MSGTWLAADRQAIAAERILDAAADLFADRGPRRVGMAEVAAAAGCSRATLYRYFENRDALRFAYVRREAERVGGTVAERIAGIPDPRRRLTEAVMVALATVRADPAMSAWFTDEGSGLAGRFGISSDAILRLAHGMLADLGETTGAADLTERARWLVRCIVSLLVAPGRDDHDERAMVERFVVPAVTEGLGRTSR